MVPTRDRGPADASPLPPCLQQRVREIGVAQHERQSRVISSLIRLYKVHALHKGSAIGKRWMRRPYWGWTRAERGERGSGGEDQAAHRVTRPPGVSRTHAFHYSDVWSSCLARRRNGSASKRRRYAFSQGKRTIRHY